MPRWHFSRTQQRFESKFKIVPGGCWEWTGTRDKDGYAFFKLDGNLRRGARVAYEMYVGPIPEGLQIDHLCRNKCCVNPEHLEAVTIQENLRRKNSAARKRKWRRSAPGNTHCMKGHPLVPGNVFVGTDGRRRCRICRYHYFRERAERQKEERRG